MEQAAVAGIRAINSPPLEAVSKLDEKEREAVETMIAGVLHMHDAKRWTQPAPPAAKPQDTKR